ncbi:MAG TPA: hypothetical protein VHB49_03375 [Bradyrhizobium sp.]|nr:hypothetical protein [Bradyrhizobium sp.]
MPIYRFSIKGRRDAESDPLDLPDDGAAWWEAKHWCGEALKEELQPSDRLEVIVTEGTRQVYSISVKSS